MDKPETASGAHVPCIDLLALWDTAFSSFKVAADATNIGDIPGGGFDRAARMYEDFEKITAYLKANANLEHSERSGDMLRDFVGQSHDFCECGTRHDFDVPPGTEKTYACECGRLMCHLTVPNGEHVGRRSRTDDALVRNFLSESETTNER